MARPLRLDHPDTWHHVTNRGAQRRLIFLTDDDRRIFVALMADAIARFPIELHSYCLMGNHFHLLVHTSERCLSRVMHYLDGAYAQRFNFVHEIDGPLFKGRFHSTLVQSDDHLDWVVRYIDRNPVVAGLTRSPESFLWSSHRAYCGIDPTPSWLTTGLFLNRFGGRSDYRQFVSDATDLLTLDFFDADRPAPAFGDEAFCRSAAGRAEISPGTTHDVRRLLARSMKQVVQHVAEAAGVSPEEIESSRSLRLRVMLEARDSGVALGEIADRFGYANGQSAGAIISRFEREC